MFFVLIHHVFCSVSFCFFVLFRYVFLFCFVLFICSVSFWFLIIGNKLFNADHYMMDMSWMYSSRASVTYEKGLHQFIDYMFSGKGSNGQISCPCIKCVSQIWVGRDEAVTHLLCDGFMKGYRIGPSISGKSDSRMLYAEDDMERLVHDVFHGYDDRSNDDVNHSLPNKMAEKFYKELENSRKELYPGCKKFSVLSFVVRLYHSKCVGKCNDKGFGMMLDTLREAFPDASVPKSLYELKMIIREL